MKRKKTVRFNVLPNKVLAWIVTSFECVCLALKANTTHHVHVKLVQACIVHTRTSRIEVCYFYLEKGSSSSSMHVFNKYAPQAKKAKTSVQPKAQLTVSST